ncbi:MAG TPA: c-type cytochrome [Candidatus Acidoferrales bacterium]|nr:c-type cytochrome [Candidatus Acidoferrales bacterium]
MAIRKLVVYIGVAVLLGAAVHVMAQEPAPQGEGQPAPAPAAPATQGGRGGRGGGGQAGPGRRGGFPQYTRPLATEDVLARGKSLYDAQCASCHAPDMRGVLEKNGPNLLQSAETMMDKQGERVAAAIAKHTPPVNLPQDDTSAIAEYIHSIQATMGGQGSPPGRNPVGLTYDILVGDPAAGQAAFTRLCSSCHSVTGDLSGIATKYPDPRTLQNTWVSGGGGGGRGGRGFGASGEQVTVTMPDGEKIEGSLVRKDDFLVILTLADGTRKSIALDNGVPRVDVKDPQEAHKKMVLLLDDPDNKNMHDITAYLATIK